MNDRYAYSVKEAAEAVGVSVDTIRRALKADAPPFLSGKKVGTKTLIRPADLDAWFDQLPNA